MVPINGVDGNSALAGDELGSLILSNRFQSFSGDLKVSVYHFRDLNSIS